VGGRKGKEGKGRHDEHAYRRWPPENTLLIPDRATQTSVDPLAHPQIIFPIYMCVAIGLAFVFIKVRKHAGLRNCIADIPDCIPQGHLSCLVPPLVDAHLHWFPVPPDVASWM